MNVSKKKPTSFETLHHLIKLSIFDDQSLFLCGVRKKDQLNSVTSILIKVSFNNVLELVADGVDKKMKRKDDIFPFVEGNVEFYQDGY